MEVGNVQLPPPAWGLRAIPDGPGRVAAERILTRDGLFDGVMLDHWLTGPGERLVDTIVGTVHRSLEEQRGSSLVEPTAYMAALACLSLLRGVKEQQVKKANIRGLQYETLDRSFGVALASVLEASLGAIEGVFRGSLNLRLLVSPWSLISIQKSMLSTPLNSYGLTNDIVGAMERFFDTKDLGRIRLAEQIAVLEAGITDDADLSAAADQLRDTHKFRIAAVLYLARFDTSRDPYRAAIGKAARVIESLEGPHSEALVKAVDALVSQGVAPERLQQVDLTLGPIRSRKRRRRSDRVAGNIEWLARQYLLYRLDSTTDYYAREALARMDNKTSGLSIGQLKDMYEDGQLYRFAPDGMQTLKLAAERPNEGHLFADIKGFTRRTAMAKEIATADFLKNEFYTPILKAAADIRTAGGQLELNNLLGDAVSFSGDILPLVQLAAAIRKVQVAYRERLSERDKALSTKQAQSAIEERRDALLARVDQELQVIRQNLADLSFESPTLSPDDDTVQKLHGRRTELELHRRAVERDAEREITALKDVGGLDAGLYIAYGQPVAPIEILGTDFGDVRVSIADGINESARGTARTGFVRDRLERARAAAGPGPLMPFRVYIGYSDVLGIADVHNLGQAMSREALGAYIHAYKDAVFFPLEVPLEELSEDIRGTFLFLPEEDPLAFVLGVPRDRQSYPQLFRQCGTVTFRGFEEHRKTQVYEIIPRKVPFYQAIAKELLPYWVETCLQRPDDRLEGPPPIR